VAQVGVNETVGSPLRGSPTRERPPPGSLG